MNAIPGRKQITCLSCFWSKWIQNDPLLAIPTLVISSYLCKTSFVKFHLHSVSWPKTISNTQHVRSISREYIKKSFRTFNLSLFPTTSITINTTLLFAQRQSEFIQSSTPLNPPHTRLSQPLSHKQHMDYVTTIGYNHHVTFPLVVTPPLPLFSFLPHTGPASPLFPSSLASGSHPH